MPGKMIVLEGIDCCGKETQANLLVEYLNNKGIPCVKLDFPDYDSPTGKIVGGPYLGKKEISESWFLEGVNQVDSKVVSMYYAADRLYHLPKIKSLLKQGISIVMDRYVYSNMAFHGGRISSLEKRYAFYDWVEQLEFSLLGLPRENIGIFLDLSYEESETFRKNRSKLDLVEKDSSFVSSAYHAYHEIALKYGFHIVKCYEEGVLSIETIHEKIVDIINHDFFGLE